MSDTKYFTADDIRERVRQMAASRNRQTASGSAIGGLSVLAREMGISLPSLSTFIHDNQQVVPVKVRDYLAMEDARLYQKTKESAGNE